MAWMNALGERSTMRNLLLFTLCAVLLGNATAIAQTGTGTGAELRGYYTGNGLLNRRMYDHAAAEYRKFLAEHPDSEKAPLARYGLAVCLFRTNKYQETVDTLGELQPPADFDFEVEVLMMVGQSRLTLGDPGEAASVFDEVLLNHADHDLADEAAALQAESLYEAGRYDAVERPCKLLDARWPRSPQRQRAELFRGLAEMAQEEYSQAAGRFEAMLQKYADGDHADRAALLLAQSLHHAGDGEGASIRYAAVIQRGRDEFVPDAMYGLAILLHRAGDLKDAGKLLDQLLAQYAARGDGVVTAALLLRGRVWFDLEDYVRALGQFERLAASGGAGFQDDAAYWSAKCALRRGEHEVAARELALSLDRYPGSDLLPQMTYDRAVALLRSDDAESAIEVLGEFRARYKDHELSALALELMAAAHHQQQHYDESLALFSC